MANSGFNFARDVGALTSSSAQTIAAAQVTFDTAAANAYYLAPTSSEGLEAERK